MNKQDAIKQFQGQKVIRTANNTERTPERTREAFRLAVIDTLGAEAVTEIEDNGSFVSHPRIAQSYVIPRPVVEIIDGLPWDVKKHPSRIKEYGVGYIITEYARYEIQKVTA